jgi:purine-binding chemotaxis protein CheW
MSIKQVLTFNIGDEIYGIDVIQVREILSMQKITNVPGSSESMLGIINVRETIVPVFDARCKFGMTPLEYTSESSIIVLEVNNDHEILTVGFTVDSVCEVSSLRDEQIEEPPSLGMSVDKNYIEGIGKIIDSFVIILNINSLFGDEVSSIPDLTPAV